MKLDEILIKVQQENEDLKARMERHAALSRYQNHWKILKLELHRSEFPISGICKDLSL